MSSDLLAEFDSFYKSPTTESNPNASNAPKLSTPSGFSFFDSAATTTNPPRPQPSQWSNPVAKQDDDIWGDFSTLQISTSQQISAQQAVDPWDSFEAAPSPATGPPYNNNATMLGFGATRANKQQLPIEPGNSGRTRSSTLDLFSSNGEDLAESSAIIYNVSHPASYSAHKSPPPTISIPQASKTNPGDVLFDADEEFGNDDDDFGDFETVAEPVPAIPVDNVLLMDAPPSQPKSQKRPEPVKTTSSLIVNHFPYPQAPKSPSFQERNPFSELQIKTPTLETHENQDLDFKKTDSPVTAWPSYVPPVSKPTPYQDSPAVNESPEEDWGDFADMPSETLKARPTTGIEADAWAWDSVDNVIPIQHASTSMPPPTNVPPPSVLLIQFPGLLNLPQSTLFKPVSSHTQSVKNRVLSDPATITFLRSYLALSTVCSHIIAGRKLRWKRDTILAQAMKIGPSAAGGKGGMKLTGVDKAEATREEREVADIVRIWQEQIGRLRSAVAVANTSLKAQGEHLEVPEMSVNMLVKAEGGLTAPRACIICGLRREERVAKVDTKVEDSFGEWWVEHWGHRTCRNFWQEHEEKLRGR